MKKEINAKLQLILLITSVSFIYAIQLVMTAVCILEEKEEKQTVADAYIRTEAVVVEAGEVKKSTSRTTGWSQRCVIEYQLANGKVRQTSYLADNSKEYGPLESGEKIEVLVSPIYQEVKSASIEPPSYIPMMLLGAVLGAVIYGGLIVRSTMEYRKKKHR